MLNSIKVLAVPFKMLHQIFRIFRGKNVKNLYFSFFKYNSLKLVMANDFSTVSGSEREIQYYYNRKAKFPHPVGIVIGKNVTLGYGCTIFQNVTIGSNGNNMIQPRIGNNVTIYANSVIAGDIELGDNVVVGANSFVRKSFPNNAIVAGCPATIIGYTS